MSKAEQSTGNKRAQEDEFEVLQAIYGEDVRDLRAKNPWKVFQPTDVEVALKPTEGLTAGAKIYAQITLRFTCDFNYPQSSPKIAASSVEGLSEKDVNQLLEKLKTTSHAARGQVMLHELCEMTKEFLYERNKPPEYVSFYDGMLKFRKKRASERERERANSEAKEAEELELELAKKDGKNVKVAEQREEVRQNVAQSSIGEHLNPSKQQEKLPQRRDERLINFSNGRKFAIIVEPEFRTMLRPAPHKFCREFSGLESNTGNMLTVTEWTFVSAAPQTRKANKKASGKLTAVLLNLENHCSVLEKECQHLQKLAYDRLIRYSAFGVVSQSDEKLEQSSPVQSRSQLKFGILHHMPQAIAIEPLSRKFEKTSSKLFSFDGLKNFSSDILSALDYLHSNNILHKSVRPPNIWVDELNLAFYLSDYGLTPRLRKLAEKFENDTTTQELNGKNVDKAEYSPDFYGVVAGEGKPSRKSDIYMFGVTLISCAVGKWLGKADFKPNVSEHFDAKFRDFLNICLMVKEEDTLTTEKLLKHEFLDPSSEPQEEIGAKGGENKETANFIEHNPHFDQNSAPLNRLLLEFEVLRTLGRGAFGEVLLVRNKLDDREYALKTVLLNPKLAASTKKMLREVKFLSRLNHENVVRYYNSWREKNKIPVTELPAEDSDSTNLLSSRLQPIVGPDFQGKADKIQAAASRKESAQNSGEWASISRIHRSRTGKFFAQTSESSEGDEEGEDEDAESVEDLFGTSYWREIDADEEEDDSDVDFEENEQQASEKVPVNSETQSETGSCSFRKLANYRDVHTLYIQMEFCEKSTLRRLIDSKFLFTNFRKIWRLFREILEGLRYIHAQGMMHRDIKPGNIFLNAEEHAKIGDFGLATREFMGEQPLIGVENCEENQAKSLFSPLDQHSCQQLTTAIGTALYTAPELSTGTRNLQYSNRVDIYSWLFQICPKFSCGVVLFEMFWPPLKGMERMEILSGIRKSPLEIPNNFLEVIGVQDVEKSVRALLKLMLTHNATERPSAVELLKSHHLPSCDMLETEFQSALRRSVANKRSREYQLILSELFTQKTSPVADYCFDHGDTVMPLFNWRRNMTAELLREKMEAIFKKFAFVRFDGHSFAAANQQTSDGYRLVDVTGQLICATYDLRYTFARFLARSTLPNRGNFKRYSFGHVYRQPKQSGMHPRESTECALDMVVCSGGEGRCATLQAAVELLATLATVLRQQKVSVRINHHKLLAAILCHFGMTDWKLQKDFLRFLEQLAAAAANQRQRFVEGVVERFKFGEQSALSLWDLIGFEESSFGQSSVKTKLRPILSAVKRSGGSDAVGHQQTLAAGDAFAELEMIKSSLHNMGFAQDNFEVSICPGLVYRSETYSGGIVFQVRVVVPSKRRDKVLSRVVAVGGRFDDLVYTLKKPRDPKTSEPICAIGASIAFDQLVSTCMMTSSQRAEKKSLSMDFADSVTGSCVCVICSVGEEKALIKEKLTVVSQLRENDIGCDFWAANLNDADEITSYCHEMAIPYAVVLYENEPTSLHLFSPINRDQWQSKGVFPLDMGKLLDGRVYAPGCPSVCSELLSFLLKSSPLAIRQHSGGGGDTVTAASSTVATNLHIPHTGGQAEGVGPNLAGEQHATMANVNINGMSDVTVAQRTAYNLKNRREVQMKIAHGLKPLLSKLSPKCKVELLTVGIPTDVLQLICSHLNWRQADASEFENSYGQLFALAGLGKFRRELDESFDALKVLLVEKAHQQTVVVLFSLHDSGYAVFL